MNRHRKSTSLLRISGVVAVLLTASLHAAADPDPPLSPDDWSPLDSDITFPTTRPNMFKRPQQCVLSTHIAGNSRMPPQAVKLIAVGKESKVSSSSASPQIAYKLWLGLENPRGFPTWTPQVKFDLVEIRRDVAAGESAAALLGGRGASRSIVMPSSPILPGQQAKGQSPIELVVAGRQRPAWWVKATDIRSGQLLGLCSLDDMTIVNRDAVGGAAGAIEPQPLPGRSTATAASSPTPARATPNWGELKSPQ